MDMWRNMGHMSNLSELEQKRGKMGMRAKKAHFSCSVHERVRGQERVEREAPTSLYDLWSSIARFSSGQELKSIYATRATRGYQKQRISSKIQAKSSGDSGFRVSKTFESFIFAPRGRDSSYFDLFSILGVVWLSFNALRGYLIIFALRGCLAK